VPVYALDNRGLFCQL